MIKKLTLSLLMCCCLMTNVIIAQNTENEGSNEGNSLLEKSQWSLNILPLNLAYEHRIGNKSTIYAQAGIGLGRYKTVEDGDSSTSWLSQYIDLGKRTLAVTPELNVQYRYYYNLEKRQAKMKNIASNSGNFVGGQITPLFPPIKTFRGREVVKEQGVVLSAMWGMQRVKKDFLVFNFRIGPALIISTEGTSTELLQGSASIGFILGK